MEELLTEKYRPKTLDEISLPNRVKSVFKNGIKTNILLYGTQGTGKTSTAKLMVKQFNHRYIYINCSKETGIDTIRNKITNFCVSTSLISYNEDLPKIVIMDEMDGMSTQAYQALRGCIEEFSSNTRFIATCNFISKVPEPIKSRFDCISFDFEQNEMIEVKKLYVLRIKEICDNENVIIDKDAISSIIKYNFPDMRSIVNKLQSIILQGINHINTEHIIKNNSSYNNIFNLVINSNDPVKNYKELVSNYSGKVDEVLNSLGTEFIEYIIQSAPNLTPFIPHLTIIAAKYQNQKINCIDPIICMLACVYEMQQTIKMKI